MSIALILHFTGTNNFECSSFCTPVTRGGLTIWKLGQCPKPGVSRGPHKMPLVPFS
ncbi:unnamed protein product [Staurois parvus]|uniref:Uncharacterized protein n=1 Tax=Staurois parvus TaxID=386267 RepID=A0ABN9BEV5_9NEOB|nr:unnamed protein product [Staurois parvus]